MIGNLISTILIVAIHYGSTNQIPADKIGGWNYTFQEFTLNGVTRIAVPFFALISGFFLSAETGGITQYINMLSKKAKTLLLPYLLASLVIFMSVTVLKWATHHGFYHVNFDSFINNVLFHPLSGQLWFLRDLIILTVISPILLKHEKIYCKISTLTIGLLWLFDYQPFPVMAGWYLINIETLFFFSLGGWLYQNNPHLESIIRTKLCYKILVFFLWFILIALRVKIDPCLDVWYVKKYTFLSLTLYKASILLGIFSLIQCSHLLHKNTSLIYLSSFNFFAYLFHNVPLSYFKLLTNNFIKKEYSFYLNFPLALILVFTAAYLVLKISPQCFGVITGGRLPDKVLKRTY